MVKYAVINNEMLEFKYRCIIVQKFWVPMPFMKRKQSMENVFSNVLSWMIITTQWFLIDKSTPNFLKIVMYLT